MKQIINDQDHWSRRARKVWRDAVWIQDEGRYALVAPCNGNLTVMLFEKREAAEKRKAKLDKTGCGGFCCPNWHRVVDMQKIRHLWRPESPASAATIKKKRNNDKCCIRHCRRRAVYGVIAKEYFFDESKGEGPYSKCPLICWEHAVDYELLDSDGHPLPGEVELVELDYARAVGGELWDF